MVVGDKQVVVVVGHHRLKLLLLLPAHAFAAPNADLVPHLPLLQHPYHPY
jgi:hypothetical protein